MQKPHYTLVCKYDNGEIRVKYCFKNGTIDIDKGYVIGGNVAYADGEYYINIYIHNGDLLVYKTTGQNTWEFATTESLLTKGKRFLKQDKVLSALKKGSDELYVQEFMELARTIFENSPESKRFDRFGEFKNK